MTTGIVPCLEYPRQTTNPKTPKPHYSCIPYTHINKEKLHSANNVLRKLNNGCNGSLQIKTGINVKLKKCKNTVIKAFQYPYKNTQYIPTTNSNSDQSSPFIVHAINGQK